MRAYGLPRNHEVAYPDMADCKEYALKSSAARLPYAVNLWGPSNEPGDEDNCHTGDDFATLAEAEAAYADPASMGHGAAAAMRHTEWVTLSIRTGRDEQGRTHFQEMSRRRNPDFRPERSDDDDGGRAERAMQAGMGLGVEAWNDEMGY